MNEVFANHSEEDKIYPLTIKEIIEAQKADNKLKCFFKINATLDKGLELRIIEYQKCICNKRKTSNIHAIATASNDVVPPVSSAPGAHPS
jgi:hypothetical protein